MPDLPPDRRASARVLAWLDGSCRTLSAARQAAFPVIIRDVAPDGLGLFVDRRCEAGTVLAVELPRYAAVPGRLLVARVRHVTAQAEGNWLLGCELLEKIPESELRDLG